MFIFFPLVSLKVDIEDWNVRSIIPGNQIMVVNVVTGEAKPIPVRQHGNYHVDQAAGLANKKVGGKYHVTKKGRTHGCPNFYTMVKCKICYSDHMFGT